LAAVAIKPRLGQLRCLLFHPHLAQLKYNGVCCGRNSTTSPNPPCPPSSHLRTPSRSDWPVRPPERAWLFREISGGAGHEGQCPRSSVGAPGDLAGWLSELKRLLRDHLRRRAPVVAG